MNHRDSGLQHLSVALTNRETETRDSLYREAVTTSSPRLPLRLPWVRNFSRRPSPFGQRALAREMIHDLGGGLAADERCEFLDTCLGNLLD